MRAQNEPAHEILVLITYAAVKALDRISFFVTFEL